MDLTLLVGNIAIVCTVASTFAGLPVCIDILNKKSTVGVSPLPFLSAALCMSLWLQYGIVLGDNVLTLVNFIALFMQVCYLCCFYYSTAKKTTLQRWLTLETAFLLAVYVYSFHIAERQTGIQTLGLLSSFGSIVMAAAPLPGVTEVFRSGSTENLPFLIIFSGFVVSTLWYIYGALIGDAFIKVPNMISASISGFQLCLFAIYDSKPKNRGTSD